jgi:hypothetical protein
METNIKTPKFAQNPSLSDLESQLKEERHKLETLAFVNDEDRHKVISKIRILRSSIDMLKGYMQHFMAL